MTPFEIGALTLGGINTAANISGGNMFGGDGYNRFRRSTRDSYKWATRYEPGLISARIQGHVDGARKAGLHPLFALGGGMSQGGFSPPGQSDTGGARTDALLPMVEILMGMQERRDRNDFAQTQALQSALRVLDNKMSADNDLSANTADALAAATQRRTVARRGGLSEFKPGEVEAHEPKFKEQGTGRVRAMNYIEYGDQGFWIPVKELSEFFESWVTMLPIAMSYHGNKNVDWDRLWYYHKNGTYKGYVPPKVRARNRHSERWPKANKGAVNRANTRTQLLRQRGG